MLKSIIKDIEDVARTPAVAMGVNQNSAANPGGGHPQIVEGVSCAFCCFLFIYLILYYLCHVMFHMFRFFIFSFDRHMLGALISAAGSGT